VTAILPRRSFSPLLGRLLHDRTADKIAGVVSRVPNAAATIIPFDVQNRLHILQQRQAQKDGKAPAPVQPPPGPPADGTTGEFGHLKAAAAAATSPQEKSKPGPLPSRGEYGRPTPPPGVTPIGSIQQRGKATVEGRVRALELRSVERNSMLAAEISDSTGDLTALFYGRSRIPGLICGARVRLRGQVGIKNGVLVMINPAYELLVPGAGTNPPDDH
jgi:hypothetical protein